MLKNRKAQGLSVTTIIVAVIGLIVLVVLVALFTSKLGSFSRGLDAVAEISINEVSGSRISSSTEDKTETDSPTFVHLDLEPPVVGGSG